MLSRALFIEEEQVQPIQTSFFQVKQTVDLEDNKQQDDENTLELKYPIKPSQPSKQIVDNNNEDYSIGCRVLVNTGHSILNKRGIIRFIGEISNKKDIWYGIELEEEVGK